MATTGTVIHAQFAPRARTAAPVRTGWSALTQVFGAMLRARHTRRLLAEMDDRLLADIGVDRGQAHMEASRPIWDLSPRR